MHKSDQKESAQEPREESQGRSPGQMQFDARKKKNIRKPLSELYVNGNFTEDRERVATRTAKAL